MKKETIKKVKKVWGEEWWLVNCDEYCGKLLLINENAQCSHHYHPKKKETFYCLEGQVALMVNDKTYMMNPFSRPKTIEPKELHSFWGIAKSTMLEISTHHEDNDVVRLTESKSGMVNKAPA